MSIERQRRALQLFDEVCDLSRNERDAVLTAQCADDPELRDLIENMLDQDTDSGVALTPGEGAELIASNVIGMPGVTVGSRIGQYRILREVSRGGMGVVYEAQQAEPQRRVALKVMREGLGSDDILRRFRQEAQLLGQLQHPGIAHVYEAGAQQVGGQSVPFFAMEFIDGAPLDVHLRESAPSRQERLELFARICDAVQHAHQKGIIHRDLKPANVLIKREATSATESTGSTSTLIDAVGQPKVLDFGVARLADPDALATLQTHAGQIVGTLAYMSPEQLGGEPQAVDTRCDVYAIGVMLYQALCGQMPHQLKGKSIAEAARIVRELEPRRPAALDPTLRGDLDTIVTKAMEKAPGQRYDSAAALADDLRRHLASEPISAHPPSTVYQLRKFASRNRALVVGVVATFVVLGLGVAGTATGLASALRANSALEDSNEKLAASNEMLEASNTALEASNAKLEQANEELTKISEFQANRIREIDVPGVGTQLRSDLLTALPENEREQIDRVFEGVNFSELARLTIRQSVFDKSIERIEEEFADQPLVKSRLFQGTGIALLALGMADDAREPYERTLAIRREELGPAHKDTIDAELGMAILEHTAGNYVEAEQHYRLVIDDGSKVLGEDDDLVLTAKMNLTTAMETQGRYDETGSLFREVIEGRTRRYGANHEFTLAAQSGYALSLLNQGKFAESETLLRNVLAILRETVGDVHEETLTTQSYLAAALYRLGRFDDAVEMGRSTLEGRQRLYGDDHHYTLISYANLGSFLSEAGRFEEAVPYYLGTLEARRRVSGPDHPETINAINNIGYLYGLMKRYDESMRYYEESYEISTRVLGDSHYSTLRTLHNVASTLTRQKKFAEAEPMLADLAARRTDALGEAHSDTLAAWYLGARNYLRWGKAEQAEAIIVPALRVSHATHGENHRETLKLSEILGDAYEAQGRFAEAERIYRAVYDSRRETFNPEHPGIDTARKNLIAVLRAQGKSTDLDADPTTTENDTRSE